MNKVRHTRTYRLWFSNLGDLKARSRIDMRIKQLALGNPGDVKPVGEGISEIRIDYGPGYRIYYKDIGNEIVVLLCGGNKSTQTEDIINAKKIVKELEDGSN
ncbi:probable addiction module killer protein [Treponema primitia ZAS-2]|uniref:Probable addiction module killer protein n=1 Tax=Treponema primitia (strain ATCC BAA-887 / DSM 12427 / ZAS-2) TaxID=545694 RepID=F5YJB9_TREPZ|nr:type II toxin-antitoxin system RelE/ParE family toxin [Treponema primitia]AEF85205.1 probable addiction module killer protein [Treponema primitia ZAS-2]